MQRQAQCQAVVQHQGVQRQEPQHAEVEQQKVHEQEMVQQQVVQPKVVQKRVVQPRHASLSGQERSIIVPLLAAAAGVPRSQVEFTGVRASASRQQRASLAVGLKVSSSNFCLKVLLLNSCWKVR